MAREQRFIAQIPVREMLGIRALGNIRVLERSWRQEKAGSTAMNETENPSFRFRIKFCEVVSALCSIAGNKWHSFSPKGLLACPESIPFIFTLLKHSSYRSFVSEFRLIIFEPHKVNTIPVSSVKWALNCLLGTPVVLAEVVWIMNIFNSWDSHLAMATGVSTA